MPDNCCDRCGRAHATWIVDDERGETCVSTYVCEPCLMFFPPHRNVSHSPIEGWEIFRALGGVS